MEMINKATVERTATETMTLIVIENGWVRGTGSTRPEDHPLVGAGKYLGVYEDVDPAQTSPLAPRK